MWLYTKVHKQLFVICLKGKDLWSSVLWSKRWRKYLYLQNQHWHCISLPMVQQQKGNSAYQELLSNFKGKRQTKFTHYHFLQLYKHWRSPGIVKMLQHCKTCILLPKLHVKLERLRTNSPVLQQLYWRSVPCAPLCNIWILQLSSEAIYNNTINTPTFNASHWILEWATSSFTFSSQKVLSKSLYCCFPLQQPLEQPQPQHTAEKLYLDIPVSPHITCALAKLVKQTDQT